MKAKLALGVVWVSGARVAINLIGLASTLLLARFLMPADFGLIAIAMAFVTIFGSISELSLSSALIQHDDPSEAHYDTAFTLNALRSVLLGSAIAALAWPISALYGDPRLGPVLLVVAVGVTISGFANPRMVIFTRRLEFWQSFVVDVSGKLIGFFVAVSIAFLYRSYWALAISAVIVQFQSFLLSYILIRYRPRFTISEWRDLIGFSVWISLGQAINTINWRSDGLLIGYFLGNQPLGYYSFGDNLASMPTREATAPIAQTLFPAFSRLNREKSRLRSAYQRSQAMLSAIALPIGFGFAILAEPLVLATVGAKWLPAVIVIQMLSGIFTVQTLGSSVQPLAMAMGETRWLFNVTIINILIRIPMIMIGIAAAGLVGVLCARICSGLIGTLINMALVSRLLDLSIARQLHVNLRSFGAAAIMCSVVVLGPTVAPIDQVVGPVGKIAILVGMGGLTYVGALWILWLASGRPDGPEAEALAVMQRFRLTFLTFTAKDPNA